MAEYKEPASTTKTTTTATVTATQKQTQCAIPFALKLADKELRACINGTARLYLVASKADCEVAVLLGASVDDDNKRCYVTKYLGLFTCKRFLSTAHKTALTLFDEEIKRTYLPEPPKAVDGDWFYGPKTVYVKDLNDLDGRRKGPVGAFYSPIKKRYTGPTNNTPVHWIVEDLLRAGVKV